MTYAEGRHSTNRAIQVPLSPMALNIILYRGAWVAQSVKRLPSAQIMILGSWD